MLIDMRLPLFQHLSVCIYDCHWSDCFQVIALAKCIFASVISFIQLALFENFQQHNKSNPFSVLPTSCRLWSDWNRPANTFWQTVIIFDALKLLFASEFPPSSRFPYHTPPHTSRSHLFNCYVFYWFRFIQHTFYAFLTICRSEPSRWKNWTAASFCRSVSPSLPPLTLTIVFIPVISLSNACLTIQ